MAFGVRCKAEFRVTAGLWPEVRASLNGEFWVPVGTVFTVNGTAVPDPYGPGFSGDIARGLIDTADGLWLWQPIGYPAATFPMRPSVVAGHQGLVDQIQRRPVGHKFVLSGYSQGALVTNMTWMQDILPAGGRLHDRINDLVAVINFGDPVRPPGIAYGNTVISNRSVPPKSDGFTTGGIAGPNAMTPEQALFPAGHPFAGKPAIFSFANDGDIFTDAPVGDTPWVSQTEVGSDMTLIYEAVLDFNGTDILAFAKKLFKFATSPWTTFWPLFQAIWNGLVFLFQGMNAPHWTYQNDVGPAVAWLIGVGQQLRVAPPS